MFSRLSQKWKEEKAGCFSIGNIQQSAAEKPFMNCSSETDNRGVKQVGHLGSE
jgi:hypothetical protein